MYLKLGKNCNGNSSILSSRHKLLRKTPDLGFCGRSARSCTSQPSSRKKRPLDANGPSHVEHLVKRLLVTMAVLINDGWKASNTPSRDLPKLFSSSDMPTQPCASGKVGSLDGWPPVVLSSSGEQKPCTVDLLGSYRYGWRVTI